MSGDSPSPAPRTFGNGTGGGGSGSIFNRNPPAERRADSPAEEKPVVEKPNTISITVRDGENVQTFKMRRDRPLQKLMQAASDALGKDFKTCRFHLEGERISGTDTPDKVRFSTFLFLSIS